MYLEIALAVIVIVGCSLLYRAEETNIDAYLATTFPSPAISLGEVISVSPATGTIGAYPTSHVSVLLLTGMDTGTTTQITSQSGDSSVKNSYLQVVPGEKVLLAKDDMSRSGGESYYITDRFRLPAILFIILLFVAVAVLFGRLRGFTSIVGFGISVGVLGWYVVPQILEGTDPLTACLIGAAGIALVSLYLAHGFNTRTTLALCGTLIALAVSALLAILFVSASRLVGLATEESFAVAIGNGTSLSLRGILLGGIIIGTLGVLDDVTIGQSATVAELNDANPTLGFRELYRRGMSVGREHIASLINTLFLAYAGVALPIILYIAAFQSKIPLWLTVNGEPIAEEIVRTMVGSIGIIFAVPITTVLAAYYYGKHIHRKKEGV